MSFAPGKLAVLAHANTFSLWHYDSEDEVEQLVSPGYFDEIAGLVRRGDLIFASRAGSESRNTTLLLVAGVSDRSITVESLAGHSASQLDTLADVQIDQAEPDQVLTYDGTAWVNRPNNGLIGAAHAAVVGNPHRTCAADVGAVPAGEKGQPGGVATLDDEGFVPSGQLRTLALANLREIMASHPEIGHVLRFDGSTWVTAPEAGHAGDAFAASHPGSGGTAHATASASEAGFLSAADKEKLDGITPAAEPNPSVATQEEVAAGQSTNPRLLTPALIKQAVITHAPPPAADAVTNVALANMAPARIKGRATGAAIGDPQDLTPVQVRTLINVADGATAAGAVGDSHASALGNPHQTSAEQVGAVPAAEKGAANGVATLDATGKVPSAQLPPGTGGTVTADQVADTATKVVMTAEERGKLSSIEPAATAAGKAGDAFASTHPGGGGTAHATASPTDAGFMSAADKQKLNAIAPLAAPNPPLATSQEIAAGSETEPRLVTPLQLKQAVTTHSPPPATDSVDNTVLANMASARLKGRAVGAGSGDPQDLTPAQARAILNVADGAAALPEVLADVDIDAGIATTIGSVTAAKLKRAAGDSFGRVTVAGQKDVDAVGRDDALTLVAGSNVTLTTDAVAKSVTIGATGGGGEGGEAAFTSFGAGANTALAAAGNQKINFAAGANATVTVDSTTRTVTIGATGGSGSANAFGNIAVAGQNTVVADALSDTLTLVAGPGMAITTNASGDSITFSRISAGGIATHWDATDSSIGETSPGAGDGGLKTSNSASRNKDVLTDLFAKMNAAPNGPKFLDIPPGTFDILGSFSPSGRGTLWTTGQALTIHFRCTVLNFTSGARADYNQVQYEAGGAWRDFDYSPIAGAAPYGRGDTPCTNGPLPFVQASGNGRKWGVAFDVAFCGDGLTVIGDLTIKGTGRQNQVIGITAGKTRYGFAKNSVWNRVYITGFGCGVMGNFSAGSGDLGDGFTSSRWEHLEIIGCDRAFVFGSNAADMMSIGKFKSANFGTAYMFRTHVSIGSMFIDETTQAETSLTNPNPKALEIKNASLDLGAFYSRPGTPGTRAWSMINVAQDGALSIGVLHNDSNHDSQVGSVFSMAKSDNNHPSSSGSIVVNGTSPILDGSGSSGIVGLAAVSGARRGVKVMSNAAVVPPIVVIPDYGSGSIGSASTSDYLESFSPIAGFKQQKISAGALVNY